VTNLHVHLATITVEANITYMLLLAYLGVRRAAKSEVQSKSSNVHKSVVKYLAEAFTF
jgi:hypothetical protein